MQFHHNNNNNNNNNMMGVGGGGGGRGNNADANANPNSNASGGGGHFGDTTYTKIFVGGLAWETQRDTMRHYFEQFGEIHEAVVITDKNTGRSKGYGFVTFKDPDSAMRACQDPSPVIDGRRANCNIASLGAQQRTRQSIPQHGVGRYRPAASPLAYQGTRSPYFHPPAQYAYPYSAYRYSGYSQDNMYSMNYYNAYGGQQYTPYFTSASASAPHSVYPNFYPFYAQYAQSSQTQGQGYGIHYSQMAQYPYLPQPYSTSGILALPTSVASATDSTGVAASTGVAETGSMSASQTGGGLTIEHSSSPD